MIKRRKLRMSNDSFCRIENGNIKLFDRVPCQSELEPLVLNVDSAINTIFSEQATNRTGTGGAGEISQIYCDNDCREYGLQWDGRDQVHYLDYLKRIRFAFLLTTPGEYYIWLRVFLPRPGTWNYYESVNNGTPRECFIEDKEAGKWFWYRSPMSQEFISGGNFLELSSFLGGKRLQQILLANDSRFIPETVYQTSPLKDIDSAVIETETIHPKSADGFSSVAIPFDGNGKPPDVKVFSGESRINVGTFVEKGCVHIPLEKISPERTAASGLKLLMEIAKDHTGNAVRVGYPELEYIENKDSLLQMISGDAAIFFDPETGDITEAGIMIDNEYHSVIPAFTKLPSPALHVTDGNNSCWMDSQSQDCSVELLSLSETKVTKSYKWPDIELITSIKPGKNGLFDMEAQIDNKGIKIVKSIKWPVIPSLSFSSGSKEDILMLPRYEPELVKSPATSGVLQEVYPRGAMCWMDLSGNDVGIFLCALEKDLMLTRFSSVPTSSEDCADLSIEKIHYIHSNENRTYQYVIGIHAGDWHWSADKYRVIFSKMFTLQTFYPEWAIDSNGWYTAPLASVEADLPEIQPPSFAKLTEHHTNRAWHLGVDHIQIWGQGAMDHACPTYYLPDPERGGEPAFLKMAGSWKNSDLKIGSYFHSSSLNPFFSQAETIRGISRKSIPEELQPPDWRFFVDNLEYSERDEQKPQRLSRDDLEAIGRHEAVIPRKYPRMSSFSNKWRDYIKIWLTRYLNVYFNDVIYHDQLGNAPQHVEFNAQLGIDGAGNGGAEMYEFVKSLYESLSPAKPDFFQIQEAVTDALSVYAAPMTSGFHRNPEVYRYTFPKHMMYFGHSNGCWKDRMQYKMLQTAFLEGMKFDVLRIKPDSQNIVWLRDTLRFWFFRGTYRHNIGVDIDNENTRWRCFYTNTEYDQALAISLCDISEGAGLKYDKNLYGSFETAVFFSDDGSARHLVFDNRRDTINLPECRTGALLLLRKVADARRFWIQAIPDPNIGKNGILRVKAMSLRKDSCQTEIVISEQTGEFETRIKVGIKNTADCWTRDVLIPQPLPRRLVIKSPGGNCLRRFAGEINGTYWGYPFNRKNLRMHFHEIPEEQKNFIMNYEY